MKYRYRRSTNTMLFCRQFDLVESYKRPWSRSHFVKANRSINRPQNKVLIQAIFVMTFYTHLLKSESSCYAVAGSVPWLGHANWVSQRCKSKTNNPSRVGKCACESSAFANVWCNLASWKPNYAIFEIETGDWHRFNGFFSGFTLLMLLWIIIKWLQSIITI